MADVDKGGLQKSDGGEARPVPKLTLVGEANSLRRSREPYVKELGKLTP